MHTAYHTPEKLRFRHIAQHFPRYVHILLNPHERWRRVAKILFVSREARQRLEWIIWYLEHGNNASLTARRFGIARKTFYKWYNQFDRNNLYSIYLLQDTPRAPKNRRKTTLTSQQILDIISLRKKRIRYSAKKLSKIYPDHYGCHMSAWHIQWVITTYKLYYNPNKNSKIQCKRKKAGKKNLTIDLVKRTPFWKKKAGFIMCLDTIQICLYGLKRYVFTAVDKYGKFAYARIYSTKSSLNGRDFLYRLYYLTDGQIPRIGRDNGSEFEKYFSDACKELKIEQYRSRVRTPKDNPNNERFNRTLQEEWLELVGMHPDLKEANKELTEWLVEYNYKRPHQALDYQTPFEYCKVLPMYTRSTKH